MSPFAEPDTIEQSLVSLVIQLPGKQKEEFIEALSTWRLLRVKLQRFTILDPAERTELYSEMVQLLGLLDSLKKKIGAHSKNSPALFFIDKASIALKKKYAEVQNSYV